jgi:hypothetical protein
LDDVSAEEEWDGMGSREAEESEIRGGRSFFVFQGAVE